MKKLEDALVRSVLSEDDYREYAAIDRRLAENSRAIPAQASLATDLEGVMASLVDGVAPRLDRARTDATKDRREKGAAELPWVSAFPAKQMVSDLSRMIWFNNRIRTSLAQLAAKHAIAARGLALQKAVVDEVLARRDRDLGKEVTGFALRLQKAGLKTASIKDLSNDAIAALASALNREHQVDLLNTLGVASSRRVDLTDAEHDAELAAFADYNAALKAEIAGMGTASFEPPLPVEPPAGLFPVDEWDYAHGPLPTEAWSAVQDFGEGYQLQYRWATSDEVEQVLSMPLPGAHDWATLYAKDATFAHIATPEVKSRKGAMLFVTDYFTATSAGTPADQDVNIPSNTVKAWLLLLAGRTISASRRDQLFGRGFFHGVVLPCHAGEPGAVRQVLWEGGS